MFSLQGQTLDNTIGAVYFGIVSSAFLYGITTLQAYLYYHWFTKDSKSNHYSVGILWVLDTLHLALTLHAVYIYIVKGFGHFQGLSHIVWSIKVQVSVNVIVVVMVQALYAIRVWMLGGYHRGILGYVVAAAVMGGFAIGVVLAYQIFTVDAFTELDSISWAIDASLAASTSIDFVIAAAMCYYLRKSRGTEMRLNSKISRLIQYTLGSGALTSACSLSALFTYILLPNTFIFLALEILLTKLYINSFLAMLNARQRTRDLDEERSKRLSNDRFLLQTSSFRSPSLPSPTINNNSSPKISPW